jgi:hypothetical protein
LTVKARQAPPYRFRATEIVGGVVQASVPFHLKARREGCGVGTKETSMLRFALTLAVLASAAAPALAQSAPATTAAAPAYSSQSLIGELLDNAETKAVLNKYIPQVVSNPMIDQGRSFPLVGITQFVPELTPAMLSTIDADLAKVQKK